jgi:CRP/FNR family transcriptional regulator, anaerobic regulatory protein
MTMVSFLEVNSLSPINDRSIIDDPWYFSPSRLLNYINGSHRIYRAKHCLIESGTQCSGLYILRSGSAKSFKITSYGEDIVTDFLYPGDVIGLDALDGLRFMQSVQFLETSSVGYISIASINTLIVESAEFRQYLLQLMSRAINHECQLHTATSHFDSQRRLANFLIYISNRFSGQGLSAVEFSLSMTRADIANYLGMAIETLSRLLTRFQKEGLIGIKNRFFVILDLEMLRHKSNAVNA